MERIYSLSYAIQMRNRIEARERQERAEREARWQATIEQLPSVHSAEGARQRTQGGVTREDALQGRTPIRSAQAARDAMIRRGG